MRGLFNNQVQTYRRNYLKVGNDGESQRSDPAQPERGPIDMFVVRLYLVAAAVLRHLLVPGEEVSVGSLLLVTCYLI